MYIILRKYKKTISLFLSILMLFSIVNLQKTKAASDQVTLARWDFSNGYVTTPSIATTENQNKNITPIGSKLICYYPRSDSKTDAITANTWTANPESYWMISLSTKGYQNITLSSKQFSSDKGPKDFRLEYRLNTTGSWTTIKEVPSIVNGMAGELANVELPTEVNDKDIIYLRWLVTSDTAVNGNLIDGGYSSIADIELKGSPLSDTSSDENTINSVQKRETSNLTSDISQGDIVFSQIYVNGGNPGAVYKNRFFELYNNTDKIIPLKGLYIGSTIYSSNSFSSGQPLSGTIQPHSYFLVKGLVGKDGVGNKLPVNEDLKINLCPNGSKGGTLVLAKKKTQELINKDDPAIIDLLAYTDGTVEDGDFQNKQYWGERISDSNIGNGTILRRTNIGSDPRSTFGMVNSWFPKENLDPSRDFVLNIPFEAEDPAEIVIHNSAYMLSPDASKITFDNENLTISGKAGAVPSVPEIAESPSLVKSYFWDEAKDSLMPLKQVDAKKDGSFTLELTKEEWHKVIYLTHTDRYQPIPRESAYTRINLEDSDTAVAPISELRKNDTSELPLNIGYTTTIEGIATTDNQTDENEQTNFFMEDSTGGINVINSTAPTTPIKIGNKYSVTGQVVFTAGMTQFIPTVIKDMGTEQLPESTKIFMSDINETDESKLVSVSGKVLNISTSGTHSDLTVSDEKGNLAIVRIQNENIVDQIKLNTIYSFTGIIEQYAKVSPYNTGYYLSPRVASDIQSQIELNHTILKKQYLGLDANFTANAKYANEVDLYYKGNNETTYHKIKMITADGRNYNAKIVKENVPQEGFSYYIQAANEEDIKTVGSIDKPNEVKVVKDQEGPQFTNMLPLPGDEIESKYPVISVDMADPNGVDLSIATISIDDKEYTSKAEISETGIKLNLLKQGDPLPEGTHTIKIAVKDTLGNLSTATQPWTFTVKNRFTGGNHYRGTTHNHTNISRDARAQGAGSPDDAVAAAKKYHYDFFAFSDHSHDIDPALINHDNDANKPMKERTGGTDWQTTKKVAMDNTVDGDFVVFPGFEMSSTTWGHSNIFGTDNFIDRIVDGGKYQSLQNFYAWTLTHDELVGQFNHPGSNAFDGFTPYRKDVDKLFTMFEIGNGPENLYNNYETKYFKALNLGWHVAPTYGEDNHTGTWGQTKKRTVIVADKLMKASLFDSMRNMRVYMSEDPNFQLDFSANDFYMGSTVDTRDLKFSIKGNDSILEEASDPNYDYLQTKSDDDIQKVELISNNGKVDSIEPMGNEFKWNPSYTVMGGQQWFVVKVTQMDGDRIYSAPIWSSPDDITVKVNKISSSGKIIDGATTKITADISNIGKIKVDNLKAHFYYDRIDANHYIGDSEVESLEASGNSNPSIVWAKPVQGNHKLIVTLTDINGYYLGAPYTQAMVIYKKSSIGDARKLINEEPIMVEGTVTAVTFKETIYFQDSSGGIMAFNDALPGSLKVGDRIRVYGLIRKIENEPVLEFKSFNEGVQKIGTGSLINPKLVSTGDSKAAINQGILIKVKGKVVKKYQDNSYEINDGSGPIIVFTDDYIAKQSGSVPKLKVGDTLQAVGLAGKFVGGNRVRVRNTKEITSWDTSIPGTPIVSPITDKDEVIIGKTEPSAFAVAKVSNREIGYSKADKNGNFKIKINKQVAGTRVSVKVTDTGGNISDARVLTVLDRTSPIVSGVKDKGIYNKDVMIRFNEGIAKLNGNIIKSGKVVKVNGKYKLSVKDAAGNETIIKFTIDKTAPSVPQVNKVTTKSTKITGKAEAYSLIVVKAGNKILGKDYADRKREFSVKISKQKAGKLLYITAKDKAENVSAVKKVTVKKN